MIFETVAKMKLAKLTAGQIISTKGYSVAGDGEAGTYLVKTLADAGTPNEQEDFALANTNVAVLQGVSVESLNVGDRDVVAGANKLFVRDVIADATDTAATVQIQRQADYSASTNPKALRVLSTIGSGVDSVEYAVSAELINNSDAVNGGASASSAVAIKNAQGNTFAGHFQVKDTTGAISSIGGSIVGQELNIQANGVDDNSVRIGYDVIARTYQPNFATAGSGEFHAGVRIRNSGLGAAGGKWNNALIIEDGVEATPNAISVANSPGTGTGWGYKDTGFKARGIDLQGKYGVAGIDLSSSDITVSDVQIKLRDKGKIEFDTDVALKWDSTLNGGAGSMALLGQNTQLTVGAAGAGGALPASPTGYLNININGTDFVMPFFAKA